MVPDYFCWSLQKEC